MPHHESLRRQKLRAEWLKENGPCQSCGTWDRLEVDHINPSDKTTHRMWGWNRERREEELAKCQVLCRSCHLQKTLRERAVRYPIPEHGHACRYREGCRCDLCRAAKSAAKKMYKERAKAKGATPPFETQEVS